ncbi:probable serine/threonine-protein kinase clkA [Nymphalis io]|uniref:probable serine/threonine-protein kinase clkA n=1 Tax=Inachis io TaxID=171585 RepID=UPI0021670C62|nr:probable serine/threonine-protein kinase clkA [Nymphalis io]
MITLFLLITGVISQELPTPASLLGPRNFNFHPYQLQFLKETKVEPTKKGPVLFPNDAPPSPRPPLVVTSRPLIESILRSDLNPNPPNNSIAQSSQINNIFKPYLNSNQNFGQDLYDKDFSDTFNNVEYQATSYNTVPYADTLKNGGYNEYINYEGRTALPPIYKALSDNAQQNLLNLHKEKLYNNYQIKSQPKNLDYANRYENNDVSDENHNPVYDHNENQNYAFSYAVRDHKTGDDFSHSQQSSGSATNGEYRVRLPDGRTQIVSYTADENGYNANVRYDDDETKQIIPVKENLEQFNSNEYYDYTADYTNNYQPYKSKFNFNPISTTASIPVRPAYDDIKDLFTRAPSPTPLHIDDITAGSNKAVKYDSTTENVVLIGGKNIYNNLKSNFIVTTPRSVNFVTSNPASYLASTIASLRDRIAAKPILSENFINRINKYLTFK